MTLTKKDSPFAAAKSVADLKGATCTSQQSTIWYDTCLPQIEDANVLSATANAPDMLMSLNAGKCDIVVTDQPAGKGALIAYPDFVMLDFGGAEGDFQVTDEEINIGISMKKGNTELKSAIDGVLSKMTKDDYSQNRWMKRSQFSRWPTSKARRIDQLRRECYANRFFRPGNARIQQIRNVHAPGCVDQYGERSGGHRHRLPDRVCGGYCPDHPHGEGDNPIKKGVVWAVKLVLNAYVEFFRGTPMMAQAMFIYYGLFPLLNINMTMLKAAIFILSINTGAYMAETVRGGILSIDPGQTEGAKSIGMTHVQTMIYVILPQALRNIMPQIGNNLIINIKDSCVLSVIGLAELLYKTKAAAGALYMNFETYTITMIMYFIMTFTCSRILRRLENKMDGPDNYDLATTDTLAYTSGMMRFPDEKKEES